MHFCRLALTVVIVVAAGVACGTSSKLDTPLDGGGAGARSSGDPTDPRSEGDGGPADGATPGDAAKTKDGDASGSPCATTPGAIACGDGGSCSLPGQFCCGLLGPGSVCMSNGSFCGGGGIVQGRCDDTSDCQRGQVCCLVRSNLPLGDSPWVMQCQSPAPLPSAPCGNAADIEHMCACDGDCVGGGAGACSAGRSEPARGRKSCIFGL